MNRISQAGALFTGLRLIAVLALASAFCLPARASLGGDRSSIQADQAHMKARLQVNATGPYEVHAIQSPNGTVVNEYLSPTGKVFAVAWHGPFMPEMQQILGTYFQQYSAALQSQDQHFGHRPLNVQQSGLVVQTGGHFRAYSGRAFIPAMLPAGVKADDIQ